MTRLHALLAAGVLAAATPLAAAQRGPAPQPTDLAPDVLALACSPTVAYTAPPTPLRVTGGQDDGVRRIFRPGDLITINAGTVNGMTVGTEFYIRRLQVRGKDAVSRQAPAIIHTAGWLRIYAVDDEMSLATITHACDTVEIGDYLEPFVLPDVPAFARTRTKPERGNYGRVMLGSDRRTSFGRGDYFIVDRGSDHGVTPGAQFVIYRDKKQPENFLYELGEAVAVDVKADTSTLLVTLSRSAFSAGDYVAIRPPQEP